MDQIYSFVNDRDVEEALDKLIFLLSPTGMTAWLGASVGPYLRKRAGERFASEGDDVTGAWAPLRPATVAIREASNYPVAGDHPINRRSGELEDWVVRGGWQAYPHGIGATLRYPADAPSGELKKKVETAQKGREFPRTVARPVLGINETDMLFVTTALAFSVEEAMR